MSDVEKQYALTLAERLLDEPNADWDDDLRLLSRQLLRLDDRVLEIKDEILTDVISGILMMHAPNQCCADFANAILANIRGLKKPKEWRE